jgi:two-component system sensor histidine kinase FlrB
MPTSKPENQTQNHDELTSAFLHFAEVTRELESVQQRLSEEIKSLSQDLAITNLELKSQIEAKGRLAEELASLLSALPIGVIILQHQSIYAFNDMASRLVHDLTLGQEWRIPRRWVQVDGAHFRCTSTRSVAGDSSNQPIEIVRPEYKDLSHGRLLVLLHDVTTTFRARERAERESKLTAMGKMAAELAHQIRTPLATALLYASHLVRPNLPEEKRGQFSFRLNDQLKALDGLVSRMLATLKNKPGSPTLIAVSRLISECKASIEPLFEAKGIALEVSIEGGEHLVSVHESEIKGGILSILENALRFSTMGQSVRLTANAAQSRLQIVVEDDGPGISERDLERLFEPFFTTDPTLGTGLGLAIAKSAVKAHGGEIRGFNRPQGGASFQLVLPMLEAL